MKDRYEGCNCCPGFEEVPDYMMSMKGIEGGVKYCRGLRFNEGGVNCCRSLRFEEVPDHMMSMKAAKKQKYGMIREKMSTAVKVLCKGLPVDFAMYLNYSAMTGKTAATGCMSRCKLRSATKKQKYEKISTAK